MTRQPIQIVLFLLGCCMGGMGRADGAEVAPAPIELWPAGAPGKVGDEPVDRPNIRIYRAPADRNSGTTVVVCPGGGYAILAVDHEGHQVAKWLNTVGVNALVLQYRLGPRYRHPAPLQDAQRAIRYARAHATELGLAADRVGILGFSAGGHLASTAATHFDAGNPQATDPLDRLSCRPDFAVFGYPVISFQEPIGHRGSARNLLGPEPTAEQLDSLSNDRQVTKDTPPVFLFHTGEDTGVPAENSVAFFLACRKAGVPAELHVYRYGPHGVGLSPGDPVTFTWKDRLADWMRASGLLASGVRVAVEGKIEVDGQPLKWGMITLEPTDSPFKPRAFAMVRNGQFKLPAASGPYPGPAKIVVTSLGSVEPQPTTENFFQYPQVTPATVELREANEPLRVQVQP